MEINIENCKSIEEYLILCNVRSIDELSNEQVLAWAKARKMGLMTRVSVKIVEKGLYGRKPDMEKAVKLLKQAIKEQKEFVCAYIENESCAGPQKTDGNKREYFAMSIR